jgi:hypothetical protein
LVKELGLVDALDIVAIAIISFFTSFGAEVARETVKIVKESISVLKKRGSKVRTRSSM